eukprot:1161133-Pelagomonas_calceolata.AAC.22
MVWRDAGVAACLCMHLCELETGSCSIEWRGAGVARKGSRKGRHEWHVVCVHMLQEPAEKKCIRSEVFIFVLLILNAGAMLALKQCVMLILAKYAVMLISKQYEANVEAL